MLALLRHLRHVPALPTDREPNMKHRIMIRVAAATLLLAACSSDPVSPGTHLVPPTRITSSIASSTPIIDTGPGDLNTGPAGASIVDSGNGAYDAYIAGQFTLTEETTLERIDAWLWTNQAGTLNVVIRTDDNGLPSANIYSKSYNLDATADAAWIPFDDLGITFPAGTYWVSLEPAIGGNYAGSLMNGAPHPLARYAFWLNLNNRWGEVSFGPGVTTSFGFRIYPRSTDPFFLLSDTRAMLHSLNLSKGVTESLDAKIDVAFKALRSGDARRTCSALFALQRSIQGLTGKGIPADDGDRLFVSVYRVQSVMGC